MRRLVSVVTWLPRYLIVRPVKGCLRKGFGCLFLFALLSVLMVGLLWVAIREVGAQEPPGPEPRAVYLLIDNSNSMWEKGGLGSDPQMLRIDAARLFISYLGVDDSRVAHQCAVIFFGGEAELVAPLTRLTDEERRAAMLELIQQPPRMGWTDQAQALALAQDDLAASGATARPGMVLLTDGKPEWGYEPTRAQREAYIERLRSEGERLAEADIPLFIILLANEATDADPEIAGVWQPLWEEMAASTAPGRFYVAREAEDLADIYHDIVVALSGSRTSGAVLEGEVGAGGMRRTVAVEPNLARLTLVASKSRPDLSVTVLLPDGTPLNEGRSGVRYAGEPGVSREEIWVIDEPIPGDWTVLVSGEGRVTVWKDYRPAPAPLPTSTPTPPPTATPSPSPTATPAPVIQVRDAPQAALVGQPITITAAVHNPPAAPFQVQLLAETPGGGQGERLLLDDGREGDRRAGDGQYAGRLTPDVAGVYRLAAQVVRDGRVVAAQQLRLAVEEAPALVLDEVPARAEVGQRLELVATWQVNGQALGNDDFHTEAVQLQLTTADGRQETMALQPGEAGRLQGVVRLQAAGPLTITAHGAGVTPRGQAVAAASEPRVVLVVEPYPYWIWGLGGVAGLGVGALVFYRRRRQQQPIVAGELHAVSGGFDDGQRMVELDLLQQPQVTVGAAPADVVVADAEHRFTLQPGASLGDSHEMLISGPPEVRHNERPLGETARPLDDGDIIAVGGSRLRYENLRLRSASRSLLSTV